MSIATNTEILAENVSDNSLQSKTKATKEGTEIVSMQEDVVNQFGSGIEKISSDNIREGLSEMLGDQGSLVKIFTSSRLQIGLAELFRRRDYTTVLESLSFLQDESRLGKMYAKCLTSWSIWFKYHLEKIKELPKDLTLQLLGAKLQEIVCEMKRLGYLG